MDAPRSTGSCKGCNDSYTATEAQIDRILASPMFQTSISVPDDVYEERLRQCATCPKLMDGMTCLVCGCFIRIAAKYRDRSCPNPDDRRWSKELTLGG